MEIKTRHIVNRETKAIEFLLYGIIGEKIDGDYFAQELNWCAKNYDTITIRINSDGGSVTQGLSIIAEMVASPAEIITQIDGIAASMAGVIALCGDKVRINDFAQIMIHAPYFQDENGNRLETSQLSAKDKRSIARATDQLALILSRRGKTPEQISDYLKKETYFNADEAKADGMVDEIINTGRKAEMAALTPVKLVAKLIEETEQLNPISNMKLIAKALGKPESSTEPELVDAIIARETALVARENALKEREKKMVDKQLAEARELGLVDDTNEAEMRELAESNNALFEKLVAKAKPAEGANVNRVSQLLNQAKNTVKADGKDFDWYQKNDPQSLSVMEIREPERFAKLRSEYEAKL